MEINKTITALSIFALLITAELVSQVAEGDVYYCADKELVMQCARFSESGLRYNDKTNNKQKVINEQDGKIDDNDLWKLGKGDYTNVRNEKGERLIKETIIQCYDYHDKEQEGKLVEFCEERETGNYIFKKKAVVIKP